jgi:signal transduction histidine kinase
MIKDLLDVNLIKAGAQLPVSTSKCQLIDLVSRVVQSLEDLHGRPFTIVKKCSEIEGEWDASGVQRVIENLVNNAVKYGKPESKITINLDSDDKDALISVHNEGNPISKEDISTLFDPFKRTSSAFQGSQRGWGIGLTLVKATVTAHGGNVKVESSQENGTLFMIRLPRHKACTFT